MEGTEKTESRVLRAERALAGMLRTASLGALLVLMAILLLTAVAVFTVKRAITGFGSST